MTRIRFLLAGLLKLSIAAACLFGSVAAYRFLLHPWIATALSLDAGTSSLVRRFGLLAALLLSYWGFVRLYERRPAVELAPRPLWTLAAAVAGALSIGVTILALYALGFYQVVGSRGLSGVAGVLGVLVIAAMLEEVAFRGILLRLTEERIGTKGALLASSLVFSVVHLTNNGVGAVTVVTVALAGLMWGLVFVLTRNLWVTAAHHCAWNATIFMIGLPLSGEDFHLGAPFETVAQGSALWTGGGFGPEDSLVNVVVSAGICLALWRLARRRGAFLPAPAA